MLRIHVQPNTRAPRLQGFRADGALKLGVTAKPEDGRANRAAEALLAEVLGVSRSRVRVVRGAASRSKQVEIQGLTEREVRERLAGALDGGRGTE
jgi:uncharacterized protein